MSGLEPVSVVFGSGAVGNRIVELFSEEDGSVGLVASKYWGCVGDPVVSVQHILPEEYGAAMPLSWSAF